MQARQQVRSHRTQHAPTARPQRLASRLPGLTARGCAAGAAQRGRPFARVSVRMQTGLQAGSRACTVLHTSGLTRACSRPAPSRLGTFQEGCASRRGQTVMQCRVRAAQGGLTPGCNPPHHAVQRRLPSDLLYWPFGHGWGVLCQQGPQPQREREPRAGQTSGPRAMHVPATSHCANLWALLAPRARRTRARPRRVGVRAGFAAAQRRVAR